MYGLKETSKIVKVILEEDQRCRNSDSLLYMKVLEYIDYRDGSSFRYMPLAVFLREMPVLAVPSFETVRRTRQKVQSLCPELAACDKVKGMRMVNETEYRQFSRSETV